MLRDFDISLKHNYWVLEILHSYEAWRIFYFLTYLPPVAPLPSRCKTLYISRETWILDDVHLVAYDDDDAPCRFYTPLYILTRHKIYKKKKFDANIPIEFFFDSSFSVFSNIRFFFSGACLKKNFHVLFFRYNNMLID